MVKAEDRIFRISRKADKFIRSLPEGKRKSVKEAVQKLTENKTQGLDIRRLFPNPKEFRLRIDDVRILFRATKEELFIFKAGYRGHVYK
ncbi:MAG: hypothetical protein R2941_20310 [Desulfobacterales bacterium]